MLFALLWLGVAAAHPFGQHSAVRLPPCDEAAADLSSAAFWERYVVCERPVVIRGAGESSAALWQWRKDADLAREYGALRFEVEERGRRAVVVSMNEFLQVYNNSDVYLVSQLPQLMRGDVALPLCLRSGGFSEQLDQTLLWMSAGNTRSQLHLDDFEGMHCVFGGEKTFNLMNYGDSKSVLSASSGWDAATNTSGINVRDVDLVRFPAFPTAPHYNCTVREGDCIYLPRHILHQVNAAATRSLSVNFWWRRLNRFDASVSVGQSAALSSLHFHQFLAPEQDEL